MTDGSQNAMDAFRRPLLAMPTMALLACCMASYAWAWNSVAQHAAVGFSALDWGALATLSIASYASFTVLHDAVHGSVSSIPLVNVVVGWLAGWMLGPFGLYYAFRYVHLEHHKHTNSATHDPDYYSALGPNPSALRRLSLPLRWLTQELHYLWLYVPILLWRSVIEQVETTVSLALRFALMQAAASRFGWASVCLYYLLPTALAKTALALLFDFLPHHPHDVPLDPADRTSKYRGTVARRYGLIASIALLWQDLHVVHHVYPTVPFYRYVHVWRAKRDEFTRAGTRVLGAASD